MKTDNTFTRNVEVLETIASAHGGLSFTEIIETCQSSSRATLARQLKVLLEGRFIAQDEHGRYIIGPRAAEFARAVLQIVSRGDLIQPLIEDLANILGESVAYMEVVNDAIQCVAKCEKPDSFHFLDINSFNRDWFRSPFARAVTVFADEESAKHQRSLARAVTTDAEYEQYVKNLKRAENRTYPTAPVYTCTGGRVIGSIGLVGFREGTDRARKAEINQKVWEAATEATIMFERHGIDQITAGND